MRVFRAQGHAEGDHRQAQGSGRGGTGSSGRRSRLADLALEIFLRERRAPEVLGALVKADVKKWWPLNRCVMRRLRLWLIGRCEGGDSAKIDCTKLVLTMDIGPLLRWTILRSRDFRTGSPLSRNGRKPCGDNEFGRSASSC